MRRFFILLIMAFYLYGCPRKSNDPDQNPEYINSFVEPSFIFLNDSQLVYKYPSDFYYPLDSKNPNYKLLVRRYYPIRTYIQLILKNEESRKLLFTASLNKIHDNQGIINIKSMWEENLSSDYHKISSDKYNNLTDRIHNNQLDLVIGAYVSLVFFNNDAEKKEIANFFRKYYPTKFKEHFKKNITKLTDNEIYSLTTQKYKNSINKELLPYFRKIKESEIEYCIQENLHSKHTNQCKLDYNDWDIDPFI